MPLDAGAIYDSNRYTIHALLTGLGCHVDDLGILPDRLDVVRSALDEAQGRHELLVTSGGVSVGEEDHVKAAVEALGKLQPWRLAVKPGRPIALGQVGRVPFVGDRKSTCLNSRTSCAYRLASSSLKKTT